jgi:hypothetical protein
MAAASNANKIWITVRNLEGYEKMIQIEYNIKVFLLRLRILQERTESGYPLVEGPPFAMILIKLPNTPDEKQVNITEYNKEINDPEYDVKDGDTLFVGMHSHGQVMLNEGGKRSRRKSHRRRKSRGKKSRKH